MERTLATQVRLPVTLSDGKRQQFFSWVRDNFEPVIAASYLTGEHDAKQCEHTWRTWWEGWQDVDATYYGMAGGQALRRQYEAWRKNLLPWRRPIVR